MELPTISPLSNEEQRQTRSPSVKDGNKGKDVAMEEAEVVIHEQIPGVWRSARAAAQNTA